MEKVREEYYYFDEHTASSRLYRDFDWALPVLMDLNRLAAYNKNLSDRDCIFYHHC
jgi:hypothetical protein